MLNQLKSFFETHLSPQPSQAETEQRLQLAATALLLEMVGMDDQNQAVELDRLESLLQEKLAIAPEKISQVTQLAKQELKDSTDYFQFTSLINQHYTPEQKRQVVAMLWDIAYSDGVLDTSEEYLVRKIADLLHVPHADFIQAKTQIQGKLGL